ncbi:MAG TPA: hypothetical protein VJR92_15725 [Gemmatimonadaceae bacterium]|nr:hypothetical protein [Gemmatimonadaceae bacterium]
MTTPTPRGTGAVRAVTPRLSSAVRVKPRTKITPLEIAMLVALAGALIRIAIPHALALGHRAKASNIADVARSVRRAADGALAQRGVWPADAPTGVTPPELVSALGASAFSTPEYTLDWDMITTKVGDDESVTPALLIRPADSTLVPLLEKVFGNRVAHLMTPRTYTLIVVGESALAQSILGDAIMPVRDTRRCVVTPGERRAPRGMEGCLGAARDSGQ